MTTDSIVDTILSRLSRGDAATLYRAARSRSSNLADVVVGPMTGLLALAEREHDKVMRMYVSKRTKPTEREWRALIEICAIYALVPGGKQIGDQTLYLSSRFTKPKRVLKLRTGKRKKVRLKLKR